MKNFLKIALIAATLIPATAFAGAESLSYRTGLPISTAEKRGAAWGKDPFVPVVKSAVKQSSNDLKLTAVFYNSKNPSAIINDRIVYRGSAVGGQKIVDIGMTHVILQAENGPLRLDLAEIPELRNVNKKD